MESAQLITSAETQVTSLEQRLATYAAHAKQASENANKLSKLLRKLESALQDGDIALAAKIGTDLRTAIAILSKDVSTATDIDEAQIEVAFNSSRFFDEIIQAAQLIGLSGLRNTEGVLFSYPFTVERGKGLSLKVGKKSIRAIRPKSVAKTLLAARERASNLNRPEFLSCLEQAYLLATGRTGRELVQVRELYDTITLLPGSTKEYSFFDFLVQLNEIDRQGPHITADGRKISFPASTGTKGGKGERLVTQDGREVIYTAVKFQPAQGGRLL